MEYAKDLVMSWLRQVGLEVESIPECEIERADIFASDGVSKYVIEVKQKIHESSQEEIKTLQEGGLFSKSEGVSRTNRFDGIMKKGLSQISNTPRDDQTFSLLWLHFEGVDSDHKYRQAFNSFYGCVPVLRLSDGASQGWPNPKHCFYFDYSSAASMKSVDALALTDGTDLQICLNEFSPRVADFKRSRFAEIFREGVFDPAEVVSKGLAMYLKSDIPRKNEEDVLAELQKQLGGKYITIRMERHSTTVLMQPRRG